jgi:hypothetical protein
LSVSKTESCRVLDRIAVAGLAQSAAAILSQREKAARQTVRQRREPSSNRESTTDNNFRRPSKSYVHTAIEAAAIRGTS